LQKLAIKGETLRMLLMYNLAKEQVKKGEKSVGLEVKLPANVMRTLDGDLKKRRAHCCNCRNPQQKEYIRSVGST
jgi:hypothetical protein